MNSSLRLRAAIISVALFLAFIGVWHLATRSTSAVGNMSPEYAKLMGITATAGKSAMPGPYDVGVKLWEHL
jgi:nitrate/nitrite transport system permease protein